MLKIGLTGGIGSGKSIIGIFFSLLGIPVFNSDEVAKDIVLTDSSVKSKIIELLGFDSYFDDGTYNNNYVAQIVFNDAHALKRLNQIIHPVVKNRFEFFCQKNIAQKYIIKESAILIETGIYKELDKIILVTAPEEIKLKRLLKRNHTDPEMLKKKIANQWSDENKIPYAQFIIHNDETKMLIPQVLEIHKNICSD